MDASKPTNIRLILILYYLFLGLGVWLILKYGNAGSFLLLNSLDSVYFDFIMKYWTWLGAGLFVVITGIVFLFYRIRHGIFILSGFLLSSIVAQILKHVIFPGVIRPKLYFSELGISPRLIDGVSLHSHFSFPSGHSTSGFLLFFALIMLFQKPGERIIFFILAIGVGYSRIYLWQHFPADVLAGSLIGVVTALSLYPVIMNFKSPWLDKPLLKLSK